MSEDTEARRERVVMETKEMYYYYCRDREREVEQEEKVNEQRGLFQTRGCRGFILVSRYKF